MAGRQNHVAAGALILLALAGLLVANAAFAAESAVEHGKSLFHHCAICHTLKGSGGSEGANLYGVVGRRVASQKGYVYSRSLRKKGGVWTRERLDKFIASPARYVPGTRMAFGGLSNADDRRALIDYLAQCR
jgi:cytochrome c